MQFYNQDFKNDYEELIAYYPRFYRDVFEMVEILKANGRIMDELEENIEQTYLNCFIETANTEAIRRLEKFLGLEAYNNRGIEERRNLVKAFFVGSGRMSGTKIKEMIRSITGVLPEIEFNTEYLIIEISLVGEEQFYLSDIKKLIRKHIPAHLAFYFSFLIEKIVIKENFNLRSFNRMIIYWFNMDGILNGRFLLDGARLLNSGSPLYIKTWHKVIVKTSVRVLLKNVSSTFSIFTKEFFKVVLINKFNLHWSNRQQLSLCNRTVVKNKESYLLKAMRNTYLIKTDETTLINSFVRTVLEQNNDYKIKTINQNSILNKESISVPTVTITHNLWHLNGSVPLDSRQTLDAYQIKEVLS